MYSYNQSSVMFLDPAIHRWIYTYHYGSGVGSLLDPAFFQNAGVLCYRFVVVYYLFVCLFICFVNFKKNATSLTFINRFL